MAGSALHQVANRSQSQRTGEIPPRERWKAAAWVHAGGGSRFSAGLQQPSERDRLHSQHLTRPRVAYRALNSGTCRNFKVYGVATSPRCPAASTARTRNTTLSLEMGTVSVTASQPAREPLHILPIRSRGFAPQQFVMQSRRRAFGSFPGQRRAVLQLRRHDLQLGRNPGRGGQRGQRGGVQLRHFRHVAEVDKLQQIAVLDAVLHATFWCWWLKSSRHSVRRTAVNPLC
jgi:hypothetical protein